MSVGIRNNLSVALNASGAGSGRIFNNNASALWIVRQVSLITSPTSSGCTCTLRPPNGIIDTSYFAGTGDVAGGDPPIYLWNGDYLELTFTSGPASGTGIVTYIYDEVIV